MGPALESVISSIDLVPLSWGSHTVPITVSAEWVWHPWGWFPAADGNFPHPTFCVRGISRRPGFYRLLSIYKPLTVWFCLWSLIFVPPLTVCFFKPQASNVSMQHCFNYALAVTLTPAEALLLSFIPHTFHRCLLLLCRFSFDLSFQRINFPFLLVFIPLIFTHFSAYIWI